MADFKKSEPKFISVLKKYKILASLIVIFILITFLFLINIAKNKQPQSLQSNTISLNINDSVISVNVEYAKTADQREIGLMNRQSMDKNSGMIFMFDEEASRSFWMKNTYIPLDMIFFDATGKIVNIIKSATPCVNQGNNCTVYDSIGSAKYVLEVNAGWADDNHIDQGTTLSLSNLKI